MMDLGSNYPRNTNDEDAVRFTTVCHNSKGGNFNLSYMMSSKMFTCFSGCSDSFDIYEAVMRNKALNGITMSFYESVRYVANLTGTMIGRERQVGFGKPDYMIDDWDFIDMYDIRETQETQYEVFNPQYLEVFDSMYHQSWIDDGISIDTMKLFGIKYNIIDHQIIIPHYHSVTGDLIGIRGRNLMSEPLLEGKKYMPVYLQGKGFNHPLGGNLYGMYRNREAIKRLKKVMIVESEKAVMQCSTMYGERNFTVATCSSNVTNMHRDIIIDSDVDEVILAFDKDFELDSLDYELKMKSICRLAQKFAPYMRVYVLEDQDNLLELKDSPTDKGQEILEKLLQGKIELTIDMINDILKGD